jgi:predicted  nucleic acid-binding Zn-ribbon protein
MTRVSEELRRQMVAEAAYFRAERRGFDSGDELDDWLEAEREVDAALHAGTGLAASLEERLATANERLKALRQRMAGMGDKARREWEGDIAKLANHRDRLRRRIRQARDESGHAAERARARAEQAWQETSALLERLGRRKTKT